METHMQKCKQALEDTHTHTHSEVYHIDTDLAKIVTVTASLISKPRNR